MTCFQKVFFTVFFAVAKYVFDDVALSIRDVICNDKFNRLNGRFFVVHAAYLHIKR